MKDLPIKEAQYKAGKITAKEFEEYLLNELEKLGEASNQKPSPHHALMKETLWCKLEFIIKD